MTELITHVPSQEELRHQYADQTVNGDIIPRAEIIAIRARALGGEVFEFANSDYTVEDSDKLNQKQTEQISSSFKSRLEASARPEDVNTFNLMKALPITSGISINKRPFYLSDVVASGGRSHCVGYVETDDGQIAPRLFYKSNSDGDWRVSPQFYVDIDEKGKEHLTYSKGETMEYGYVRETRLHDDLRAALSTKEALTFEWEGERIDWLLRQFTKEKLGSTFTYDDEVKEAKVATTKADFLYAYKPGQGFNAHDGINARDVFRNAELDEAIKPNFSVRPVHTLHSTHPQLGSVKTELYEDNQGTSLWHLSSDAQGRVWVSGATKKDRKPSSYGTDEEVVSLGIYDNKPIEYGSQVDGLVEGVDYKKIGNGSYVDITPLLDNLPVIKDYRQSRQALRAA
jgi:hypothetical protein